MKRLIFILVVLVGCVFEGYGQGWFELGVGDHALKADNYICTLCTDTANNVYAAGYFNDTTIATVNGKIYVAKWDAITHNWNELGSGTHSLNANAPIYTICSYKDGSIYATGAFTDSPSRFEGNFYVAKWNPMTLNWSKLGEGVNALNPNGEIKTICTDDSGNVYAAGNFNNIYGYFYVAKWNGTTWHELGHLNANFFVNSICVDDSFNVYAAGHFTDGVGHTYVAKWSPTTNTWGELGVGFDSFATVAIVYSIFADASRNIYAAVSFDHTATGAISSNVFKWNGTNWNQLGDLNGSNDIKAICKGADSVVYAVCEFTDSAGYKYVAKYDPTTDLWRELGALHPTSSVWASPGINTVCVDKLYNVYAAGFCTDDSDYWYVAEYGINDLQVPIVSHPMPRVFPNPCDDMINFECSGDIKCGDFSYVIYDIIGKIYSKNEFNNIGNNLITIDLRNIPSGEYVFCGHGKYTFNYKFIKK